MAYQIPQFLMGQTVGADFSPFTNALGAYRDAQKFNAQNALARDKLAEEQRQFALQNALARDQYGLAVRTADRADEAAPLQRALLEAQAAMQRAHAGYYRSTADRAAELSPLEQDYKRAQTAQTSAHADYYRAGAEKLRTKADPPPVQSAPQVGIDANGQAYFIPTSDNGPVVENRVAGATEAVGDSATREHGDYGPYGRTAQSVPGVVVNGKGASDQFATRQLAGQRAIDSGALADRDRAVEHMRMQQAWTQVHGRPPRAGKMYDKNGYEVDIGPLSASADTIERKDRAIEAAKKDIAEAEKTLKSGWAPGIKRVVAPALGDMGTAGRLANNVLGLEDEKAAFDKTKMAVMQTVYALSGKTTTNTELNHFLDNFMPRGGESADMLEGKYKRLNKFLTTLQGKVKKGMVYDQAEAEAMSETVNAEFGKLQGRPAPVNPKAERLKNKYGLE